MINIEICELPSGFCFTVKCGKKGDHLSFARFSKGFQCDRCGEDIEDPYGLIMTKLCEAGLLSNDPQSKKLCCGCYKLLEYYRSVREIDTRKWLSK